MHISNAFGYLPLTTGNKTELALGYCTLYGDMNGGFNPIADLYKDQVYAIARHINTGEIILGSTITDIGGDVIPRDIIDKPPSAELSKDQTDEEGLEAHYGFLNAIVRSFVESHINDFSCFKRWVEQDKYPFATEDDKKALRHHLRKEVLAKDDYYRLIRRIDYMEFKRRQAAPTIKVSPVAFGTGRRLPIVQKVG
jgi:NAD+ synthase (glutamine-hydrolysing)